MHDVALLVSPLLFAGMGVVALFAPNRVTEQFGIPPLAIAGRSEVRAVYGGFGQAMASMLVIATQVPGLRTGISLAIAAALVGMAVGRIVSALIDRALPSRPLLYLAIEIGAASLIAFGASTA